MTRTFRRRSVAVATPAPAINTTPLIDVLLVLLIMIIMTLPIPTHKLPIDLPTDGRTSQVTQPHRLDLLSNGRLLWDGAAVTDGTLPGYLASVTAQPDGVLHMRSDPNASYARFAAVLDIIKRSGVEHLGFIGNEAMVEHGAKAAR